MTSKDTIHSAWYISPTHQNAILTHSNTIKTLIERLLDVVPPSYHPASPIKHLRTDTGFILNMAYNFGGESLSPFPHSQVSQTGPSVQHSLRCFLRFYATSFHGRQDGNITAEALKSPAGDMASYMEGLVEGCSQDLEKPCGGRCDLACGAVREVQGEALLYSCNLVTGYILSCMVGSEAAEEYFREQFRMAWPRVQELLGSGEDDERLRVPLKVGKGILAHL